MRFIRNNNNSNKNMKKWDQADISIPQINDNIAKPIVAIMIMVKPSDFQGD